MWMHDLLKTYDMLEKSGKLGIYENNDRYMPLAPPFHITASSGTQVTIDEQGNLIDITKLPTNVIIPVTLSSMGRTSNACPHAYADKVDYYVNSTKKVKDKDGNETLQIDTTKRLALLKQLSSWMDDNVCLNAIYKAVDNRVLEDKDVERNGVIRWSVQLSSGEIVDTWKDLHIRQLWTEYYRKAIMDDSDKIFYNTCMISGKSGLACNISLKNIITSKSNAKVISESDYLYKGRLKSSNQCFCMGIDEVFKIFNTLKYICHNDAISCDSGEAVMWSPEGIKISEYEHFPELYRKLYQLDDKASIEYKPYKEQLYKLIYAQADEIDENADVVLMTLKALTPGRISITSYNKWKYHQYLKNIYSWESAMTTECYKKVFVPSLSDIINYAYGNCNNGTLKYSGSVYANNKYHQLVLCRLNGNKIPTDIIHNLMMNCKKMHLCSKCKEYLLKTTIACIKYNMSKENINMIDENLFSDVNFLYGRLIAIYHKIELDAKGENTITNAQRLHSEFSRNAERTLMLLDKKVQCYFNKLPIGTRIFYEKLLRDIRLKIAELPTVTTLDAKYLFGYDYQLNEFYTKKSDDNYENT